MMVGWEFRNCSGFWDYVCVDCILFDFEYNSVIIEVKFMFKFWVNCINNIDCFVIYYNCCSLIWM